MLRGTPVKQWLWGPQRTHVETPKIPETDFTSQHGFFSFGTIRLLFFMFFGLGTDCPLSYYIKQKHFLLTALDRVTKLQLGNTEECLQIE